jgi:hypothetical protein
MTRPDAAAEFRIGFEFTIGHCPPYSPKYLAKWGCPDCGHADYAPDYSGYGHDAYAYSGGYGYGGYAAAPVQSAAPVQYAGSAAPAATVQPTSYSGGFYPTPSYWYGR